MSARIIVIKNCSDCPDSIQGFLIKHKVCSRMFYEERRCPDKGTPDWCPLPKLPEKMDKPRKDKGNYERGYWFGWNACLDAITVEEEQ